MSLFPTFVVDFLLNIVLFSSADICMDRSIGFVMLVNRQPEVLDESMAIK